MKTLIFFFLFAGAGFGQDTTIHRMEFGKPAIYETPRQQFMRKHHFQIIEWTDAKYRVMRIYDKPPQFLDYYTEWKPLTKELREFLRKYNTYGERVK